MRRRAAAELAREHRELYEASDGEAISLPQGRKLVLVTTLGARSGAWRTHPVMRVEHEGNYVIVASRGGADQNPAWYWNVRANPSVRLQDGAAKGEFVARELHGDERALWWGRAVASYSPYAEYRLRTERLIPVFLLEPK
ncbi:MAG: nitroreductase family deazaflavin-dependent oxidoreductase [Actinomycetota bacterium]